MSLYENIVHRKPFVVARKKQNPWLRRTTNGKTPKPLYGYIKNVILPGLTNKPPILSSFYNFSIDKRPVKGYHVFNTKTEMQ